MSASEQITPPITPPGGGSSNDSTPAPTCGGGRPAAGCSGISCPAKPQGKICGICNEAHLVVKGKVLGRPRWIECVYANCDWEVHAECLGFFGPGILPDYYCPQHTLEGRRLKGVKRTFQIQPVPEDRPY